MSNEGRLHGKVALVTGAGSGIGRAASVRFAQEGAKVAVCELSEDMGEETVDMIKKQGGEAFFIRVDVSKSPEVQAAVQSCIERYETLDTLYNCAGIWRAEDMPVDGMREDVWDSLLAVHLTGTFLFCKHAILEMIKNKRGSIINMSSTSGLVGTPRHAYSAAKGGIQSLTRSIAVSYAPYNIRANAICPGPVDTPMGAQVMADPQRKKEFMETIPMGRLARADEVAALALFLASDDSSYITGTFIPIDGGYTAR